MAKAYLKIGFRNTVNVDGVWRSQITERNYACDVIRNTRRYEAGQKVNDDILINNQFSIVADGYATENYFAMCYISWMGAKWKVTNVEVQRPRLLITAGGIYNGEEPEGEPEGTPEDT